MKLNYFEQHVIILAWTMYEQLKINGKLSWAWNK